MDSREVVNKALDVTSKIVDQAEGWLINQHNEITRLKAVNADLLAALEAIEGGRLDGASEMAVNGQWHQFAQALQGIARAAIAKAKP